MNVKEVARVMDKRKVYTWGMNAVGRLQLYGKESGKLIYSTAARYDAEVVTKKLRGMGMNIVGEIPLAK